MRAIKILREKNKKSQEQLAEFVGVSVPTVSRWESDEFSPRADKLPEIANFLECKVDDLYKEV